MKANIRFYISLPREKVSVLSHLADIEGRDFRKQASILISEGLELRGLLPKQNMFPSKPGDREPCADDRVESGDLDNAG